LPLFVFAIVLIISVSAISFFIPSVTFLPEESVRQLCVACKVSLYVYFCWLRY
jgi:hypothetical protein